MLVAVVIGVLLPTIATAPPAGAANGEIFTIAGSTGGSGALGVGLDAQRVVWTTTGLLVSDFGSHGVRRVDLGAGTQQMIAGNGALANGADGVAATTSEMWNPQDMARDAAGNVYVADALNRKVRKITPGGVISTYAGTGSSSSNGDGGPATAAAIGSPKGLALDAVGNLYIADALGDRIRRVTPGGIISTVAGSGTAGFSGDGGAATAAQLNAPEDVAIASTGELLIADTQNHRIRQVSGGIISTVAGNGTAALAGDGGTATAASLKAPAAVEKTAAGMFIADWGNSRIRKVTGGIVTTYAGGGSGTGDGLVRTSALIGPPTGISVAPNGEVYFAEEYSGRARKIGTDNKVWTVAGNGTEAFSGDGGQATSAQFDGPRGIAVAANGDIYIADAWNGRIRKRATTGLISTVAGGGSSTADGGSALGFDLGWPSDVDVDLAGNLYVADTDRDKVFKITPAGILTTYAGTGAAGFSGDGGWATNAKLNDPRNVAVAPSGAVFVADTLNHRVRRIDPDGSILTVAGTGVAGFSGDGGLGAAAKLDYPTGLAVEPTGSLLIVDTNNNRVRRLTTDQKISTVAGNGSASSTGDGGSATAAGLHDPSTVAVDEAGNIVIGEYEHIRRVDSATNTISTIAGNGSVGWSGDYGQATAARIVASTDLAFEAGGNLISAQYSAGRLRRITGVGSPGAKYHPLTPARILDSRDGTGGFATPWPANTTRDLKVTGVGGVPATGVGSVVLNVTVTGGTAPSHLTAWPSGVTKPLASNLNWPAGDTRPNLVTVKVGAGGKVSLFNNAGSVHVIADVVGWYDTGTAVSGDLFTPLAPARILDSRDGTGGFASPWGAGTSRDLQVATKGGVPAGATVVALNVTVVNGSAPSHLTVWPTGVTKPTASNLNWPTGAVRPNLVIVKLGTGGKVSLFNNGGTVDVIADVVGYFGASGDRFHPTLPHRLVDSRDGTGTTATPWAAGSTRNVAVASIGPVPKTAKAVVLNITVTGGTAASHLTVWPAGVAKPTASSLNWNAGQTVPNLVVVKVGDGGLASIFNNSGNAHVIADVVGWYG